MKIELMGNYPDDVKDYVKEYNEGVGHKDINVVGTAISSLVQLLFSPVELNRQASIHALDQVGKIQPGFLKSAAKTLAIRYQGGGEKKFFAQAALEAIFIGKKAEKLITDNSILQELKSAKQQKDVQQAEAVQRDAQLVQQIQQNQVDLSIINAFPEIRSIGQYYNTCILNNDDQSAVTTINNLVDNLVGWIKTDIGKFTPGCLLLGLVFSRKYRKPFLPTVKDHILQLYYQGDQKQKTAAGEIIESILDSFVDMLPNDLAAMFQAEAVKKKQNRLAQKAKEMEQSKLINRLKVPVNVGWTEQIKKLVQTYNEGIVTNKEKQLRQFLSGLDKSLGSQDKRIRKNATNVLGILLGKNPDFIQGLVDALLQNFDQPVISEILGTLVDDLAKLGWANANTVVAIRADKKTRELEEQRLREERKIEYDKVKQISITFDADWEKPITNMIEKMNQALMAQDMEGFNKILSKSLKKFIYAEDLAIRKEGQITFANIAQKYPDSLNELMGELSPLFLSEHEQRNIAVDVFGQIFDLGIAEQFFKINHPEVFSQLAEEWANRKQELENLELQTKFDAIKADVTQLRIKDTWPKNIQKICRNYNNGIKTKQMQEVMDAVKNIVDIVMKEKKEEIQEQANQVLGLIAKRNIELIQPTINLFLTLLDGNDRDMKVRAIKGLGEVTRQRPGWAYFGIEKLIHLTQTDPVDDYRMKAMLEIGRIGEKDPVMLIEYVEPIMVTLAKDNNKHVRRLAAWTLGKMADAIPLEAKHAIPALTDALHDEYVLVRKFADKALSAIRDAIRKAENQ